ncbi:MAG: T9SS type A sorting domain-containing protein [Calditrichaeota bacterium]|nr:T9SS type A sorting domain-containing protein [Calditrichota bacterium]
MNWIRLVVSIVAIISTNLLAQPNPLWIRTYDGGEGRFDVFFDIYVCADGGFCFCGTADLSQSQQQAWIVRTDSRGDIEWSTQWNENENTPRLYSLVETDDGGFATTGFSLEDERRHDVRVIRLDAEGEIEWSNAYGGDDFDRSYAIIELKSDEFLIAGKTESFGEGRYDGYLLKLNGNGRELWAHTYGGEENEGFSALREVDGGAIAAGSQSRGGQYDFWLVRVDEDGEEVWSRNYGSENDREFLNGMATCPDGGYVLCGQVGEERGDCDYLLIKVDREGRQVWSERYEIGNDAGREQICTNVAAFPANGGYALVGHGIIDDTTKSVIVRVDGAGEEQWQRIEAFEGINQLCSANGLSSVVVANDHSIVATGSLTRDVTSLDALVVRLVPDPLAPVIISYTPEILELTILQGDSINFAVRAIDHQNDSLSYLWTFEDDTVSTDTTVTIDFEELGGFNVTCIVSDGEFADSVRWLVEVVEFYISEFNPDSLDLVIRRNTSVDFSIAVRQLVDEEINYLWTFTDRLGNEHEIGEIDSTTVLFDLKGEHQIECLASRGEFADSIVWIIDVRSVLWSWCPIDLELSVPVDTTIDFGVVPFNYESDSLAFYWTLDGEPLDVDSAVSEVSVEFPEIEHSTLTAIVREGVEADTVSWAINVFDPDNAVDRHDTPLPECVSLSTPYPNPFNAVTKITYSVPEVGYVHLSIYDLSGRETAVLVDSEVSAGRYITSFDALHLPTGLYFIRLNAGGEVFTQKVMLIR